MFIIVPCAPGKGGKGCAGGRGGGKGGAVGNGGGRGGCLKVRRED